MQADVDCYLTEFRMVQATMRTLYKTTWRCNCKVMQSKMLDAAEVQQRSARKVMWACHRAACSTRQEWWSFPSYVNVNVLLQVSWRDVES